MQTLLVTPQGICCTGLTGVPNVHKLRTPNDFEKAKKSHMCMSGWLITLEVDVFKLEFMNEAKKLHFLCAFFSPLKRSDQAHTLSLYRCAWQIGFRDTSQIVADVKFCLTHPRVGHSPCDSSFPTCLHLWEHLAAV